jgi:hypothetical protein
MGAIPPETFAEEIRRLERDRVASFVAALWAAGGWDTEVDGNFVIVERDGECKRLAVTDPPRRILDQWGSPAVPEDADAVVPLGDGERTVATEPPTIDASALRDRLLFGIEPDAANRICETHFGVPARDKRWDADPEPEPPNKASDAVTGRTRSRTMLVATVVVAFLVLVVGPGALLGATPLQLGQTSGDSTSDALEPVPEPTCDRGPGEVATTVGGALQPASEGASGLQVLWTFTDPQIREDRHYRSFRGFYAAPQFDPLREADGIVLDGVVRDGDEADAYVIARTGDRNVPYVFDMVQRERDGQSCWFIRSVAPSG